MGEPDEQDTKKPQPFWVEDGRDVRRAGQGYAECFVHESEGQTVQVKAEHGAEDFDLDDEMLRAKD